MSADRNLAEMRDPDGYLIIGGAVAHRLAVSLLNDGPAVHTVTCSTCDGERSCWVLNHTGRFKVYDVCPTCSGAGTVTVRVTAEVVKP